MRLLGKSFILWFCCAKDIYKTLQCNSCAIIAFHPICAFLTKYSHCLALCIAHCALCFENCALNIIHCALSNVNCTCIMYRVEFASGARMHTSCQLLHQCYFSPLPKYCELCFVHHAAHCIVHHIVHWASCIICTKQCMLAIYCTYATVFLDKVFCIMHCALCIITLHYIVQLHRA